MTANSIILVAAGFAALLAAEGIYYFVLYLGARRRAELHRRLRSLGNPAAETGPQNALREDRFARTLVLRRLLRPFASMQRLEKLLLQTDLTWTVAMVLAMSVLCAAVFGLTLFFLLRHSAWLALLGAALGLALPTLLVLNARARRSQKISEQLPDALEMMMRSLRAGHGVGSGFKLVAEEMPAPIAVEFGSCFEEQKLGVDFRDAVQHMTERAPGNLDLKIFAVSLVIQRETGGNLVEILEQMATTVRERFKFYGKLKALTAEGRYSGYILGCLPFVCLALVGLLNPEYLVPLVADPIGRTIAAGGLALWVLGALWMKKLVRVDY